MNLLENSIWSARTQQQVFRRLVTAMSSPGEVVRLPLPDGERAAIAVLAALLDNSVSLCDYDCTLEDSTIRFLQATPARCDSADYVLVKASNRPADHFAVSLGELASPEKSATLILEGRQVLSAQHAETALGNGDDTSDLAVELSGSGVEGTRRVRLLGFERHWFHRRNEWVAGFPLGVDLLLVDSERMVAIPRTSKLQIGDPWVT
jgi:alpha-D-ribose 1-methylphosphonate 5-triphosphate synthase subunit PhnH